MQVVINLDSFWVGFVAGLVALTLLGVVLNARTLRNAKKAGATSQKKK
jgi:hypothetical protein